MSGREPDEATVVRAIKAVALVQFETEMVPFGELMSRWNGLPKSRQTQIILAAIGPVQGRDAVIEEVVATIENEGTSPTINHIVSKVRALASPEKVTAPPAASDLRERAHHIAFGFPAELSPEERADLTAEIYTLFGAIRAEAKAEGIMECVEMVEADHYCGTVYPSRVSVKNLAHAMRRRLAANRPSPTGREG